MDNKKGQIFKMDLGRKQGVRGFELRESQRMMGGKAERWRGTDIGSCEGEDVRRGGAQEAEEGRQEEKRGGGEGGEGGAEGGGGGGAHLGDRRSSQR